MKTSLSKLIEKSIKEALTAEKDHSIIATCACDCEEDQLMGDFEELLNLFTTFNKDEEENELENRILALHMRPLFIISSMKFNKLEDAVDQLEDWFVDGTIDPLTAIYRCYDEDDNEYYTISSTEFDDVEEALNQLGAWHVNGTLSKRAKIHESRLHDTYEPTMTVKRVSMFDNESEEC